MKRVLQMGKDVKTRRAGIEELTTCRQSVLQIALAWIYPAMTINLPCKLEVTVLKCRHDRAALLRTPPDIIEDFSHRMCYGAPAVGKDNIYPGGSASVEIYGS